MHGARCTVHGARPSPIWNLASQPLLYTPMFGSGTSLRPLGGVALLVLQLATVSAWAVLEAQANAESRTAHIERSGDTDCPPPHNETLCRLCQIETGRLPLDGPVFPAA